MRNLLSCLIVAASFLARGEDGTALSLPWSTYRARGGDFCNVTVSAVLPDQDATNSLAVGACYFQFWNEFGLLPAEETLAANSLKRNAFCDLEFLFPDTAAKVAGSVFTWSFQVRLPDAATEMRVCVKPWCKTSKAGFFPVKIRSCEQTYDTIGGGMSVRRKIKSNPFHDTLAVRG